METSYKGCNISIHRISKTEDLVVYQRVITTHSGPHSDDHRVEETMDRVGDEKEINHVLLKAQRWIDDYLSD